VLIRGAAHAKSIVTDPETWFKAAFEFIGCECGGLGRQKIEVLS
jgi:hypothetical protein